MPSTDTPTIRDATEAARTAIRARWPVQIAPNTATAVAKVAVEAAAPILRAANERIGCCQAAVDSDGHTHAETCVYLLGLREGRAEGRTAAAEDIRNAAYPDPSPCIPAWHAGYTEAWERAARVAEGADQ